MKKITTLAFAFVLFFGSSFIARADSFAPFTNQMHRNDNNSQVKELQLFLSTNPLIYALGTANGNFGPATQAAVGQFQLNYNLPTPGVVGPATLARLNAVIGAGNGLDIFAPIISNVNAQTSNTSVTVNWTTDTSAQGKVFYSTSPLTEVEAEASFIAPYISGTAAQSDSFFKGSQSINISGLSGNTLYYYVIMSNDQAGNVSVTNQSTFHTI